MVTTLYHVNNYGELQQAPVKFEGSRSYTIDLPVGNWSLVGSCYIKAYMASRLIGTTPAQAIGLRHLEVLRRVDEIQKKKEKLDKLLVSLYGLYLSLEN